VNRLRNRLIIVFLAATLAPLGATIWVTSTLLKFNLNHSAVSQLDVLERSLGQTGREFYKRAEADLKRQAEAGQTAPQKFTDAQRAAWPPEVRDFADSGAAEKFVTPRDSGRLDYLLRRDREIRVYSAALSVDMNRLEDQIRDAGALSGAVKERDLQSGVLITYVLLALSFWLVSLAVLVFLAHRISRPIQSLTAALTQVSGGNLDARVAATGDDEVGRAIQAFNSMAARLQATTERLVTMRQLEGVQLLARKMAHEVKNSLTPIRLTVEEMLARQSEPDRGFMEQATQIVVDEIETLERRVRAFSQFATEPPVRPGAVDVNALLQERVAFLKTAHPEVAYECRLIDGSPRVFADQDLIKGILTNLLENAAEAAGEGGKILGSTSIDGGRLAIDVNDSGPGLSRQARESLFQPTISFKKRGMGLGLSIARRGALLSGGDIVVVKGELGGAAFRVLLPVATDGDETHTNRG